MPGWASFRRRNALATGGRTMTGNPYSVSVRTPEILAKLEANPIWRDRASVKAAARPSLLVGTGVAVCTKDYGTGADCSLGRVEIDAEGRVSVHGNAVEMGSGIGTALTSLCGTLVRIEIERATGIGRVPGHPVWHLAPLEMGWQGKTLAEICQQIKDPARNGGRTPGDLIDHIGADTLVGRAWNPGVGRTPAPGTQKEAGALVAAWVKSGAACP